MVLMMNDEEFEKIKKDFIVDQNAYDIENVPEQIKRLLNFAKVGTGGKVFIESHNLTSDAQLRVVLIARFLANKLQEEIKQEVSIEELSQYTHLDKDQVRARMSAIVREKFAERKGKGVFVVLPFRIKKFMEELSNIKGK